MTSADKKIDELYRLIEGIEIGMLTTRRVDGSLVSRPMATQKRTNGADLYFVTEADSPKLRDLDFDRHVNVAYYRAGRNEWVSVAGTARVSKDRKKIKELYSPDWKAWFAAEDGELTGPDDPRIALLLVDADSVEYLVVNKSRPMILFEVAKGMVTGSRPDIGEERHVSGGDLLDAR